jgi:type VI secretion system protein ImpE
MTSTPQSLLTSGDPNGALQLLQAQVRANAADAKLRIFLFQLLCVVGAWPRALTQLKVCGELDAGTLAMVATYRTAIECELLRESVFEGKTTPMVLGQPQPWVALLIEALKADAQGLHAAAQSMRDDAFDQAPTAAGTLNGEPFEWLADADPRLGPVLEVIVNGRYAWVPFASLASVHVDPPTDLRDLVWTAAHLTFPQGGEAAALIPSRYIGTAQQGEGPLQMARQTVWRTAPGGSHTGIGQRVLATDSTEHGLLDVKHIAFHVTAT